MAPPERTDATLATSLTLDQLATAEDLDLGATEWMTIDQERIDGFAEATEDRQWIHVDRERAAAGPFGGTIAHGYLLLSLIPSLLFELVHFADAGMIVNYGLDKLRFLAPVPAGSRVRFAARVGSSRPRSGGVLGRFRGTLEVEGGRRAFVADFLLLALPASAEAISPDASPASSP